MAATSLDERLAQERRARLQAEQLLALRSEELYAANRKLTAHAHELSSQVIEKREENELLRDQTTQTKAQLEVVKKRAVTAQRRLWDALTATEDGFAIFDRDWRLVAANPAFFDVFDGISDVSEGATYESILRIAVDEGIIDLEEADPDDWIDRMVARWEMDPIPRVDLKLWNGAYIRLNDKQTPQGDFVSLAVDITPNMRRERILRRARDKAMGASRAKSKFLANMSHEIRTPMNGVVSMAELLRDTDLDEEQQIYADTIKSSGESLLVIINDILDYSKIEAGKLELREESFDLNAMVREIFRLLKPTTDGKDLDLRLDYDIFLPQCMIGDRGRIRQVLTNLIGNAVKFTQEGSVTVRVMADTDPDAAEGVPIRVVVEDTGVGIAPEKQAHVFGEFNQVEDGTSRRHDGTGLGLAISRRLVEMMGGEMWLESKLGQGSAFGFALSLAPDPAFGVSPVAGLPPERARVLLVGGDTALEDALMDRLGRLHAETSLVRRIPSERDLDGTQAVVLCGCRFGTDEVSGALNTFGFAGQRLVVGEPIDGFLAVDPAEDLADLRARIVGTEADPSSPPDQISEVEAPPEISESEPAARPRLLAAEDNKTNQLVFKTMIKGLDVELEMVANGLELLEAYKSNPPDLVMTDISMPEMDGLEAAREIRAHEAEADLPRCRMIAMTAHALEGDRERILAAGLDDYITKPLKKAVIHEKIADGMGVSPPDQGDQDARRSVSRR